MSHVIIYNTDEGLTICSPAPGMSIDFVKRKDTPNGSVVVSRSELPTDWSGAAWEFNQNNIVTNLVKTKALTKSRLRYERTPLLEALDVKFQRALEDGASTAEIVAEKRRLRDITLFVDQATTVNQLRALKCSSLALEDPIPDAPHPFTPLDPVTLQPLATIEEIN